MILNEIFNKSVRWELQGRDDYHSHYAFTLNEKVYDILFECLDPEMQVWEFTFTRDDMDGTRAYRMANDGEGEQFVVFATIKEIFEDYIKHMMQNISEEDKPLYELRFEADPREPSRVALYTRMVKQVTRRYPDLRGKAVHHKFTIMYNSHERKQAVGESHDPE